MPKKTSADLGHKAALAAQKTPGAKLADPPAVEAAIKESTAKFQCFIESDPGTSRPRSLSHRFALHAMPSLSPLSNEQRDDRE